MSEHPLIAVVDDDESVRESLPDLLRQLGYAAAAFSSAEEFLDSGMVTDACCLILDVAMPGMSGFDLRDELHRRRLEVPIVFITARTEFGLHRRALLAGAVDCLAKPFSDAALVGALDNALRPARG